MRHMLYLGVLLLLGVLAGTGEAWAQVENYNESRRELPKDVIRCESDEGRTRQCPADTSGGVKLVRRLSDSPCVEGESWGFGVNGVWVAQGCRGEFAVGFRPRPQHRDTLRCESGDGRWQLCPLESKGSVQLVKQLSRNPCILDENWGRDERGIWVAQGCRGEFRVEGGHTRDAEHVRCESKGGKEQRCKASIEQNVRLVRQLSESACIKDQTWGWDGSGVWVKNGCRAEFEVH